jgi:hypothetical protein
MTGSSFTSQWYMMQVSKLTNPSTRQATAPGYEGLSPAWNLPALASPAVAGAIQEWAEKQYYQPDDDENQVELRQVAGNARYQEVGLDKGNHGHYIIGNHMWLEWQPKLQNLLVQSLVRQEYCERVLLMAHCSILNCYTRSSQKKPSCKNTMETAGARSIQVR